MNLCHMILQFIECYIGFTIHYETLDTTEMAVFLVVNNGIQIVGFITTSIVVSARHGSFKMFDHGFQLFVDDIHYGIIAHRTDRKSLCFAQVAYVVAILAHPDRGA